VGMEFDCVSDPADLEAVLEGRLLPRTPSALIPDSLAPRVAALDVDLQRIVHAVYADPSAWESALRNLLLLSGYPTDGAWHVEEGAGRRAQTPPWHDSEACISATTRGSGAAQSQ
jgi:hypothetical protein